ncbi:MAG: hypothetical protein IKF72_07240 [Kiritimatiellae bacterium]|nr:hypothetical protein [Kiritimatiellia bacterium]
MAEEVNLCTLAVKDGSGNLVVLWDEHTSGWWAGNQYSPFDGLESTYIDPKSTPTPTWVGYELTTPQVVTRIRFCGRRSGDGEKRLCVCRVEGANQADFSDAVTLLETKDVVPTDWRTTTTGWFDVPARAFTAPQTFKYIRFIQPAAVPGEGNTFCGNIAEVEFYGMDAASYASYVPTVSQETNLRLYALHDSTGALDIVSDKTEPWDAGYEYTKAFDGSIRTFYDPKDKNNSFNSYVGYALVKPMAITRIRYCGRGDGQANSTHTERLLYCKIEGANQADFSDAVTLHLCKNVVPLDWHLHADWLDVVPDAAAGTNAFKYLRFIDFDGHHQCGDISELEFYGMSADALAANVIANPHAATGLVATRGAYPEVATELRWQVQPGVSDSTVLRAPGANGPWTELARLSGVNSYTDTTAPVGVLSYYRVVTGFTYDGQSVSVTNEAPTVFRRWRLLERDPGDMTQFRSGVKLIYTCGTGGNLCWTPSTGTTLTAVSNSLMIAFNNVLYKYSSAISEAGFAYNLDFADTKNADPARTCIGVDLGEPAHFAYLRFFSGINESNKARLNGVVLSGSNSTDWKESSNSTILTTPLVWTAQAIWYEEASHDTDNAYRYLFCHNPDNNVWNNNASELQFYGWFESDVAAAAQNVTDIAATCGTTPSVTLTWTPAPYGTYTIERKADDGAWSVVASALPASTATWTDSSVTVGTLYTYRITTVNGANEAYSADCEVRPYLAGNGVGLHGVWSAGYTSTNVCESVVAVTTNAVIDFANVSVGGATENFFVRWTGKLIAPVAGDYVFDAEADDTVTLWIDGKPVLYRQSLDGTAQTAPGGALALTAGEHDIVMTWFQTGGDNLCRLYWSGPVARAVIPASQLVPVVPSALPEDWAGARTFNGVASANNPGDVRFNGDGTIDLAYGGNDLYLGENGYNFLWKPMKGDFSCVARVAFIGQNVFPTMAQKGGLMVRSALDAGAPFEACVIKMEGGHLKIGGKRCTARGDKPMDGGKYLDGTNGWTERVSDDDAGCLLRIRRHNDEITYSYRKDNGSWKDVYRFKVSPDVYGETVYVGLTSTSYVGYEYSRTPTYDWRFLGVKIRAPQGFPIIFR